jgi:hypothetical protein
VIFDTAIASKLFQKIRQLLKILGGAPGAKPGILPVAHLSHGKEWWGRVDLNHRPPGSEPCASFKSGSGKLQAPVRFAPDFGRITTFSEVISLHLREPDRSREMGFQSKRAKSNSTEHIRLCRHVLNYQ